MPAILILPLLLLAAVACERIAGDATDPGVRESPLEILQRSDEAMRGLRSFRALTRVVPSVPNNPSYEAAYDFRGPRCILPAGQVPQVQPNGACLCGPEQQQDYATFFDRAKGGRPFGPPFAGGTLAGE